MKFQKNIGIALLQCCMFLGAQDAVFASKSCPVDLQYQQIYDSFYQNESEAIQHQFTWQETVSFAPEKELEIVQDFTIPFKPTTSLQKADYRTPVYGYNKDGSLDTTGGMKKTYNSNFTEFYLRYHGALEAKYPSGDPQDPIFSLPLVTLTPEGVKEIYGNSIPYFVERGFEIQGSDIYKEFTNQYIWSYTSGQSNGAYVAMRLIYEDSSSDSSSTDSSSSSESSALPSYVDLHASRNPLPGQYFNLNVYESNPKKFVNGDGYPTRIPITTNFCDFEKQLNRSPIAFYDKSQNVLTVHVPTTDEAKYLLTKRVVDVGNPLMNVNYIEHLAGFDGSFKTFRRDQDGMLVACPLSDTEVFAQVSEDVTIRSRVDNLLESSQSTQFFEFANPIRDYVIDSSLLSYTGAVANRMNGGTKAFDTFAEPVPFINAYEASIDPIDIPEQEVNGRRYARGDNPTTKIHESFSSVSTITLWDNDAWGVLGLNLPLGVLKGTVCFPENVSITAIPETATAEQQLKSVQAHEYTHQTQNASGVLQFLPYEGMAVGIELDYHVASNTFAPFRAGAITQRMIRTLRGEFSPMRPDAFGLSTYGMGIWWKFVQDQFDFNNQVMRRTLDVLTHDTLGPLLKTYKVPDQFATFPVNSAGGNAALDQAMHDLFNKNLKDVWNDYIIGLTMIRNNTSIPAKWRFYFPFWIYNTEYSGYSQIFDAMAALGNPQFANFWEVMNENGTIPANYNTPYTGETFIRTLPTHFDVQASPFRAYAFNVKQPTSGGPQTINVSVPYGEWKVTLVQFTSDGTEVGSFIADGPHTVTSGGSVSFNVANHSPAFSSTGNIRLICVNTTFDSDGTQLEDYFTAEAPNARIVIDAPVI